jgi:uncharacterized protein (DUF1499 family)
MTPLAWLIGLVLPACAAAGAQGLPVPPVMDMGHIQRPASPNTAFAAPAGTQPAPDIVTPAFAVPAAQLYAAIRTVALGQPRIFLAAEYPAAGQLHVVARSAMLNFPDLIAIQVADSGAAASTLLLYSRSVYGYGDFGVNRRRLVSWLAALRTELNHPGER